MRLDLQEPVPGEWVLHAGFAIERLDEDEALETLAFVREAARAALAAEGTGETDVDDGR